jgi:hypothetical protein
VLATLGYATSTEEQSSRTDGFPDTLARLTGK